VVSDRATLPHSAMHALAASPTCIGRTKGNAKPNVENLFYQQRRRPATSETLLEYSPRPLFVGPRLGSMLKLMRDRGLSNYIPYPRDILLRCRRYHPKHFRIRRGLIKLLERRPFYLPRYCGPSWLCRARSRDSPRPVVNEWYFSTIAPALNSHNKVTAFPPHRLPILPPSHIFS
jgi:hypothetical protein